MWFSPVDSSSSSVVVSTASPLAAQTVIVPATCRPSMTITAYVGNVVTWNLQTVVPSNASATWTPGGTILACTTSGAPGSICSAIAGSTVSQGTVLTLTHLGTLTGGGLGVSFSCQ
jgi:hypothetical protein